MRKSRLLAGILLILVFVAILIFVVESVKHGLPPEGQWKGNIHQWKPHYNGEGLVIILVGIVGSLSFMIGYLHLCPFTLQFVWYKCHFVKGVSHLSAFKL